MIGVQIKSTSMRIQNIRKTPCSKQGEFLGRLINLDYQNSVIIANTSIVFFRKNEPFDSMATLGRAAARPVGGAAASDTHARASLLLDNRDT